MRRIWRENGLSIVLFVLFIVFLIGQSLTGWHEQIQELQEHGRPAISFGDYLTSGSFLEVTAENWESEFLQMGAYVMLTVFLFQKGSAESKPLDKEADVDRDPRRSANDPKAPAAVRAGGWRLRAYENSLGLAFAVLFALSFVAHAIGGTENYNEEQMLHGEAQIGVWEYLATTRFWYESFQNWQSEFLAIFSMVVLSIFLRQRGSPESKPVDAPHSETES